MVHIRVIKWFTHQVVHIHFQSGVILGLGAHQVDEEEDRSPHLMFFLYIVSRWGSMAEMSLEAILFSVVLL